MRGNKAPGRQTEGRKIEWPDFLLVKKKYDSPMGGVKIGSKM